ncbi:MAG TPA: hypothetical protein DGH68_09140 [Bacteroidetes bacterium]|jgi:hypothetical protein|nr:hypothetical protein [Bacteroidota bacterium]
MNSKLFCASVALVSFCMSVYAQIPNAGFENWTGGEPDGWVSSNINGIVVNVTQSAVAHSNSSAVRGAVVQFFTGLLGPFVQVGPGGRGFGYNQRPVSVTGYYQFFPQGGDRFGVNVVLYHGGVNGTPVGTAALAISQSTSSYIQFNAPFVYHTSDIPDTCVLQFQIVGPVTGPDYHLGSYFLLDDLSFAGSSAVNEQGGTTPATFELAQNYPNPFNPNTTISYQLPTRSHVTLKVYDVLGGEVATVVDGIEQPGFKEVLWNASGVASGVYFCRLQAGDFIASRRLLLLK